MAKQPISMNNTLSSEDGATRAKVNSDGSIDVNVVGGGGTGGTSSNFGSAFPGVGTAAGFEDAGGDMAPVVLESDGSLPVTIKSGGGSGGTASNFSASFPAVGTAVGMSDGANMVPFTTSNGTALDVAVVSGGGSNSSVSATGATVPADATFVGAQDGSGNLVSLRGTAADGLLVNLGANNDVTITGTVAATQSGTWNVGTVTTVTTVTTLTGTTTLTPGTGAANLGKAEDAAHASGDTGVMALAVRRDTASAFGADGDYTPFRVDQYGDLNVRVVDNTGAGLTYNSNGIATAANSSPVVNAAASSLTINQVAMSSTANQIVASNSNRRFVTVLNQGSGLLYVNTSSGVTTSNGFMLVPGAAKDFYATTAVYGITPTGQTSIAGYSEEAS